jgi:hypothetical protein
MYNEVRNFALFARVSSCVTVPSYSLRCISLCCLALPGVVIAMRLRHDLRLRYDGDCDSLRLRCDGDDDSDVTAIAM